jgi:hypothetical protein
MKCIISGQEFDDAKSFPAERLPDGKVTDGHVLAAISHAAEASKWRHVQLLVDGKEILAGHLAPQIDTSTLTVSAQQKET